MKRTIMAILAVVAFANVAAHAADVESVTDTNGDGTHITLSNGLDYETSTPVMEGDEVIVTDDGDVLDSDGDDIGAVEE